MELNQEDKKIPDFLQDIPAPEMYLEQKNTVFKNSNLKKLFVAETAVWFAFIVCYLNFSFCWDNLSPLLPNEFIRYLIGMFVPLALILLLSALVYNSYITTSQKAA